ncbi:hypothetical protein SELMODRAFT_411308 [Selaginella moellendorffii]|uniref:Uncharacterized protein n=1 Tax=Selaginella moellendorffii TaxID=88036 RepID=D8RH81_SELML|nr:hypothetical protein SELMODRAFT_411308 [Selaginella moellendorffii]
MYGASTFPHEVSRPFHRVATTIAGHSTVDYLVATANFQIGARTDVLVQILQEVTVPTKPWWNEECRSLHVQYGLPTAKSMAAPLRGLEPNSTPSSSTSDKFVKYDTGLPQRTASSAGWSEMKDAIHRLPRRQVADVYRFTAELLQMLNPNPILLTRWATNYRPKIWWLSDGQNSRDAEPQARLVFACIIRMQITLDKLCQNACYVDIAKCIWSSATQQTLSTPARAQHPSRIDGGGGMNYFPWTWTSFLLTELIKDPWILDMARPPTMVSGKDCGQGSLRQLRRHYKRLCGL